METFARAKLSSRENEILELATRGFTDAQIAHDLDITVSTVSSYWVRIRTKLGAQSRTELIARILKNEAETEISQLRQQKESYEQRILEQSRHGADAENAEIYRAALDALPEAALIRDQQGRILFVNEALERLFGYVSSELINRSIEILVPRDNYNRDLPEIATCVACPEPLRYGIDHVIFGRHRRGTVFRIILIIGSTVTTRGYVSTCVFRSFVAEIDDLRRHTRAAVSAF